jgi:hypothetical protein
MSKIRENLRKREQEKIEKHFPYNIAPKTNIAILKTKNKLLKLIIRKKKSSMKTLKIVKYYRKIPLFDLEKVHRIVLNLIRRNFFKIIAHPILKLWSNLLRTTIFKKSLSKIL